MPRLMNRKGVVCVRHESFCKLAGGSDFVSPLCAAKDPEAPVLGPDEEIAEMTRLAKAERRAQAECISYEQARADDDLVRQTTEEINARRWARLSPKSKAAELDGREQRMAEAVREALAAAAEARAAADAAEEAFRASQPAAPLPTPQRRRQRAQAGSAAAAPPDPTGVVVDLTAQRVRRRHRRPQFSSVNYVDAWQLDD